MAFTSTFTLDIETVEMLDQLSLMLKTTRSELIRNMIRKLYEAEFSKEKEQSQPVEG